MRPSLQELHERLINGYRYVPKESFFRHTTSGKVYEIILLSIREHDNAVLVNYSDGLVTFTRPIDEFLELVTTLKGRYPRFTFQGGRVPSA